jgi:hypothetical protein
MHEYQQPDNEPTHTGTDGSQRGGYRKPPIHTRFKAGVSGNPSGRPKGHQNVKAQIRDVYFEPVYITDSGKRRRVSAFVAILLLQRQRAINGNTRAAVWMSKLAKEFRFIEQPLRSPVSDLLFDEVTSRLSVSALDEMISASKDAERKRNMKNKLN